MTAKECLDKKLPTKNTKELYEEMGKHFGQKGNDAGNLIMDTSSSDHGVFEDCHTQQKMSTSG